MGRPQTNDDWLELDRKYRIQSRYTAPIVLERGSGVYVWDVEGNKYMDFESGQVCAQTGHCHPKYVDALKKQAETLIQTGSVFTTVGQILLAEKLAQITPPPFEKSFFAATGSESNEVALRIAKLYTGRFEVAAVVRGYHGLTLGSYSVTGFGTNFRRGYGPGVPGVTFIPTPYVYRSPFGHDEASCVKGWISYTEDLLDRTTGGQLAAIIVEPILSAGGIIDPPVQWFKEIRRIADERGALLIFDEAQTGLGRTGKWFAFEHYGVTPDIITLSKSLGGQVPLSAVVTSREIAEDIEAKQFYQSSSHTGDPFLAFAGLANIEIIEQENLVERAATLGQRLKTALLAIKDDYEVVGDVRGRGLMLGIEFVESKDSRAPSTLASSEFTRYCRDHGLLVGGRIGEVGGNVVRILPPLVITEDQIDEAVAIMRQAARHAQEAVDKAGRTAQNVAV